MDRRPDYYLAFVSYPGGLSSSLNVAPLDDTDNGERTVPLL